MSGKASLLLELEPLAQRVGLAPTHVERMLGLRTRRWPMTAQEARTWRPTAGQAVRTSMLREVCEGIASLMGDEASDWLDAWMRAGPTGSAARDAVHDLRLELRRQCGLD